MATRAPFLTQPYGAYYHRDVPKRTRSLPTWALAPLRGVFAPLLAASGSLQGVARATTACAYSR